MKMMVTFGDANFVFMLSDDEIKLLNSMAAGNLEFSRDSIRRYQNLIRYSFIKSDGTPSRKEDGVTLESYMLASRGKAFVEIV